MNSLTECQWKVPVESISIFMTSWFTVVFSSLDNHHWSSNNIFLNLHWIALHGRSTFHMAGHQILEWVEWPLRMAIKVLYRDRLLRSVTWVMHLEGYYVTFHGGQCTTEHCPPWKCYITSYTLKTQSCHDAITHNTSIYMDICIIQLGTQQAQSRGMIKDKWYSPVLS